MTVARGRVRRVFGSSRVLRLALATSLIASVVVLVAQLPVRAATQTFTATADAQVQEANASTTFGTSTIELTIQPTQATRFVWIEVLIPDDDEDNQQFSDRGTSGLLGYRVLRQ